MCLAISCSGGARPDQDTLEDAARTNRDGCGIAWVESVDGEPMVKWEKGLEVDDLIRLSEEVPHPYIVHLRAQSTGDSTDNLTHPFPISPQARDDLSGESKRVLFHNGTVSDWEDRYKSFIASRQVSDIPPYGLDCMSDTRAMAYMVYHMTDYAQGEAAKLKAENILQVFGGVSRWAILDAEDAMEGDSHGAGIRLLGTWWYGHQQDSEEDVKVPHEVDNNLYEGGLLYSNKSWKRGYTTTR
jgi:hypothetical protein